MNYDFSSLSRQELEERVTYLIEQNKKLENLLRYSNTPQKNSSVIKKIKPSKTYQFSRYNKRHVLFKIAYLGWDRNGFAVQESTVNTVEAELFKALMKTKLVESRETSNYHRCGRTDKGVSAYSQVISITVRSCLTEDEIEKDLGANERIPASNSDGENSVECPDQDAEIETFSEINYPQILNRVLPSDIRVLAWSTVKENFSARFDCVHRVYKYFFPRGHLDLHAMNTAAQDLVGEHDFRNFCKMDVNNGVVKYIRRIKDVNIDLMQSHTNLEEENSFSSCSPQFSLDENKIMDGSNKIGVITIVGNAFLWHQIRAIMTVLLLIGEGKENPDIVRKLLDIDKCPRKPQYGFASEIPLVLFSTSYENVIWRYDPENTKSVISKLESYWATHSVRSAMLECMISDLCGVLKRDFNLPKPRFDQSSFCLQDPKTKTYKPLLQRETCKSLENRIKHYVDRNKISADSLKVVQKNSAS